MTTVRPVTVGIVLAAIAGLIGYDLIPFATPAPHDTISEVMRDWGSAVPLVPYAMGFLCGHFWWRPTGPRRLSHGAALGTAGGIGALLSGVLMMLPESAQAGTWGPLISLLAGVVAGALLWPLDERRSDT